MQFLSLEKDTFFICLSFDEVGFVIRFKTVLKLTTALRSVVLSLTRTALAGYFIIFCLPTTYIFLHVSGFACPTEIRFDPDLRKLSPEIGLPTNNLLHFIW